MLKNKLDYKLINLALIVFIFFLLYQTGNLITGILWKLVSIISPFFFGFVIAYALNPILRWLTSHKVPKFLGIIILTFSLLGLLTLILVLGLPLIVEQLTSLFNGIITFVSELSTKYDVNIGNLQVTLTNAFNDILTNVSKVVSNGAINAIGISLSYLTSIMITLSATIYLLIDMDKIRTYVKKYLLNKPKKAYLYVSRIDDEMKRYLSGLLEVIFITLFEYSLVYKIIGHPNALLLGFMACVAIIIPYFGGIFVNIVAAITAFVISSNLFIKTIICFVILSWIDGYLIHPLVYGKTNKIHPLVVIMAVFAGGILFGVFGIILSLPIAIIILATIKFFKTDISVFYDKKKRKKLLD